MWKFYRSFVVPRWYASNQWALENNNQRPILSQPAVIPSSYQKYKHSGDSHNKRERFKKQSERFWKCSQFQYLLSKSFLYDTAGWVGTATILCLKYHHMYFNSFYKHERVPHCSFQRNVLAMVDDIPRLPSIEPNKFLEEEDLPNQLQSVSNHVNAEQNSVEDFHKKAAEYEGIVYYSAGLASLDIDNKKAFRNFQKAARLGSSSGFYNLGLCYEFGKGTRVNPSRAAFCYRKAAMKGHGLASFNLAMYFKEGLGGLPVDPQAAKLLLAAAAEQDVPQAQLLIGLEYLEDKKWSDAYEIFDHLAKKDNLDGKYYLGICFENGWGVDKNLIKAAAIYTQNSAMGHAKSTLELSRFYEEGLGGCELDLELAMALCQISADKGEANGKEALKRLKAKREKSEAEGLFQINLSSSLNPAKSQMRTSNSLPEFASFPISSIKPSASILSYLDLVSSKTKGMNPTTFHIGDELNLSSSVISCPMS